MKKTLLLMAATLCCWVNVSAFVIPTCPEDQDKAAADYYLSNPYYAYCADWSACKLSQDNDGTIDFNGGKSIVFGGINLTMAGTYKMVLNFKCGQNNASVKLFVNGVENRVVAIPSSSWAPSSITIGEINLVAGENTIAFQQNAQWPLLHNFQLSVQSPCEAPDYYLTHPYLTANSEYWDEPYEGEPAITKKNSVGWIKIKTDGWSDFHWNGPSAVVYNNINMSEAGKYNITMETCTSGKIDFVVNGVVVETMTLDGTSPVVKANVELVAGMNTIALKKNTGWPSFKQITIKRVHPEADYYLTHPYLTANSEYWDEQYGTDPATTKKNSVGWIKIYDNGWSDFHWDGPSAVVYNNINMSEAGKYNITMETRTSGKIDFVVNGVVVETMTLDGTSPVVKANVELVAGMNTIALKKNDGWPSFKQISIEKVPTFSTYSRDITSDSWGTICLPWASVALEGAIFYDVLGTKDPKEGVALVELGASDQLTAGKPYVFLATSEQIKVTYDPETEVAEEVPGNNIIGSFDGCNVPEGKYIIIDNLLYKTADATSTIAANRAYFDVDNMGEYTPSQAPGRTVVFMGVKTTPTDLETVDNAQCTMHDGKYIHKGRFVFVKDGKMYNALGF